MCEGSDIENKRDLKTTQETAAVSKAQQKPSTETISSLTDELSSIRVDRANLMAAMDEITALVQRMKDDVERSLSNVSTEVLKS